MIKTNEVKVWNKNTFPHEEKFKGTEILIPAGGFVKMDYDEAILFKGQFFSPVFGKDQVQKKESYKWIEIDADDRNEIIKSRSNDSGESETEKVFVCQACSKEFRTKNGLLKHIKDKHQSIMADKDAKDELLDNEDLE